MTKREVTLSSSGGNLNEKAPEVVHPTDPVDQIGIPAALPLTTDDPNFDPDWDWTIDEPHDLFALTKTGVQAFENVRLPYFSDNGPAANDFNSDVPGVRDILPEDGWVLLFRDFGTPDRGAVFPRFILYNRFRGLLRLFYFNPYFPEAFTYGVVTLQRQSASKPFGLLTFTDLVNATLSDFDPDQKERFVGRLEPITWNYADFMVVGFEPNLPDDARFEFEVRGVRESDISLEGDLTLDQVLKKTNLSGAKSGGSGSALDIGEKSAGLFKNLGSLKEALTKSVGADKLENVSLAGMSGLVSAGIALFKLFLGGNKSKQTQLMHFKGDIKLTGTIHLEGAIGSFLLRVPGARHLGSTDLPFYDKPLGVFNLRSKPVIDVKIVMELDKCRNTSDVGPKTLELPFPKQHRHTLRRPQVIVNPDAGLKAEVAAGYVRRTGVVDFSRPDGADGFFAISRIRTVIDRLRGPANCDDAGPEIQQRKVAIRLMVTPEEEAPDFTPVSIVKLYPTKYAEPTVET